MATVFDYQAALTDADNLIKYFGMKAVLRRPGIPDRPCTVVIIEYDPRDQPAELATPVDRKVIMSAANVEIQTTPPDNEQDHLVTFIQPGGTVENEDLPLTCKPKPTAPAGVTVLWEFTVRR
jgi:hypothetical protein